MHLEPAPVVEPVECVPFVRDYLGIPYPSFNGYAGFIEPNTQQGRVGVAVLTFEGQHHTAVIIDETDTHWILIESNYNGNGQIQHNREIPKNSKAIHGYFDKDLL